MRENDPITQRGLLIYWHEELEGICSLGDQGYASKAGQNKECDNSSRYRWVAEFKKEEE